jgi:NADP-dependent 3-hydroxy acid dehydrogenase YdfG
LRVEVQTRDRARAGIERLEPADVADAVQYIVTRPRRVAVNEIVVRPTEQVE